MQYDFWNNPLVVSAMRIKYRRSSPGIATSLYVLVLLTIGGTLLHYQDSYTMPPGLAFLMVVLSLQFLISGALALFTVANSMNAEVANRTLDFQRIVSLKPHEILLGKMIGEPALSYFLAMSSVPFALFCWLEGSTSAGTIAWFYVNLATFTLGCAAIGTIHTLVLSPQASAGGRKNSGSLGMAFFWVPLMFLPSLMARGTSWLQESWVGAVVNLCTPIGSLQCLFQGEPWQARISLWGYEIPSLVIAPVTQLVLTYWIVMAMSRRLQNPIDPPVRRSHTYAALLVFDLIVLGTLFEQWRVGTSPARVLVQYGAAHVIASVVLLLWIMPAKQVLQSWLWRFQHRQSWLRSSLLGSRAEITMVLPMFCLIGVLVFVLGFVVPTSLAPNPLNTPVTRLELVKYFSISSLLILACGMMNQWFAAVLGRTGLMMYCVCLLLILIVPPIVASLLVYPDRLRDPDGFPALVANLSPGYFYLTHAGSRNAPFGWVVLGAFALVIFLVCFYLLRRWLQWQQAIVADKLKRMGVR